MHTGFWWGNPKERGDLKPLRTSWEGVDSCIGQLVGFCKHNREDSDVIKCREHGDQLRNCQLLKDVFLCSQLRGCLLLFVFHFSFSNSFICLFFTYFFSVSLFLSCLPSSLPFLILPLLCLFTYLVLYYFLSRTVPLYSS